MVGMKLGQPINRTLTCVEGIPTSFPPPPHQPDDMWRLDNDLKLTDEQLEESLKKLIQIPTDRHISEMKKLESKYTKELVPQTRLTQEEEAEQVQRMFEQAKKTHDVKMAAIIRKNTQPEEHNVLDPATLEESVDRLYTLGKNRQKDMRRKLLAKYHPEPPPAKRLSTSTQGELVTRMYVDGKERERKRKEALKKKYVDGESPWEKSVKAVPLGQLTETINRLHTPRKS